MRPAPALFWTVVAGLAACAPTFTLVIALNAAPAGSHRLPPQPAPVLMWESEPGFWGEVHPAIRDGVRSPMPAAGRG